MNEAKLKSAITNLIPDILKLVDEGRIALTPAVELSYLNSHEQEVLNEIMSCDELTPSLSQAQRLRKLSEDYTLTDSGISQIMSEIKGNQRLVIYYKFVGYLDIDPTQCHPNYTADIREGVAVEYVSCEPSENLKELFPEEYDMDDDFEEEGTEQA